MTHIAEVSNVVVFIFLVVLKLLGYHLEITTNQNGISTHADNSEGFDRNFHSLMSNTNDSLS